MPSCACNCLEPAYCGYYTGTGRMVYNIITCILICLLVYILYCWWIGKRFHYGFGSFF